MLNSPFCLSLGQYYKTLRIRNLGRMDKLRSKLVRLSQPVTDKYKDPPAYYAKELITDVITLIVEAPSAAVFVNDFIEY